MKNRFTKRVLNVQKKCKTKYQICRESALRDGKKITQAEAAELCHVSTRQFSDYETGEAPVPDDIVGKMAKIYNTPLLAWWHMKNYHILGEFLPEVPEPKTNGDMAFQAIITQDRFNIVVAKIKKVMADGKLKRSEKPEFEECIQDLRVVSASTGVMAFYGEQVEVVEDDCDELENKYA